MHLQVIDSQCCVATHLTLSTVLKKWPKWLIRKPKMAVLMVCSGNIRRTYEACGMRAAFVRLQRFFFSCASLRISTFVAVNSFTAGSSSG